MQIPFAFFFHYLKFWYHIQEYIHIYLFFIVSSLITCKTHKREKSVFLCSLFYLLLFGFVFYVVKRTTRESASLSIMWVPGVELAYQTGLVASSFQPLNHLVAQTSALTTVVSPGWSSGLVRDKSFSTHIYDLINACLLMA